MSKRKANTPQRFDVVWIRKSTREQDNKAQIDNVKTMLDKRGVPIPRDEHWFIDTVSRRKVTTSPQYKKLLPLIEGKRVGTIYVESQDRLGIGTNETSDFFSFVSTLRKCGTKLIDLTEDTELTDDDFITELKALLNSHNSKDQLRKPARQSIRSRVNDFKRTGSWPTGPHPFGYGKACYAPDGRLKWEWHPVERTMGHVYDADAKGKLKLRNDTLERLPRKDRHDTTKLVPCRNKKYTKAVKLAFEYFARLGLSRRQITIRLNKEGYLCYQKPFTTPMIREMLLNPAYAGDTHFGKSKSGELYTFDSDGIIVKAAWNGKTEQRAATDRIVMQDTHEPLVDRATWNQVAERIAAEGSRTNHAPRNPAYYLKPIFVCGHCGRNMSGRTESDGKVNYVCSSYVMGRSNGYEAECGYQSISHDAAEQLLLDKLKEINMQVDTAESDQVRSSILNRIEGIEIEDELADREWNKIVEDGSNSLLAYLREEYELNTKTLNSLRKSLRLFYQLGKKLPKQQKEDLPIAFAEFRRAIKKAERIAVEQAKAKLAELRERHERITDKWIDATDMQQEVLQKRIDEVEEQIKTWEPRTQSITARLHAILHADDDRAEERQKLIEEWPKLDGQEKGEALRRVFNTVRLFWDKKFHAARVNPDKPRKTDRPGRYSYTLDYDRIEWEIEDSKVVGTW